MKREALENLSQSIEALWEVLYARREMDNMPPWVTSVSWEEELDECCCYEMIDVGAERDPTEEEVSEWIASLADGDRAEIACLDHFYGQVSSTGEGESTVNVLPRWKRYLMRGGLINPPGLRNANFFDCETSQWGIGVVFQWTRENTGDSRIEELQRALNAAIYEYAGVNPGGGER